MVSQSSSRCGPNDLMPLPFPPSPQHTPFVSLLLVSGSLNGWLAMWACTTLTDHRTTLEYLAFLGFEFPTVRALRSKAYAWLPGIVVMQSGCLLDCLAVWVCASLGC